MDNDYDSQKDDNYDSQKDDDYKLNDLFEIKSLKSNDQCIIQLF